MSQFHLRIPANDVKIQLAQRAKLAHDLYMKSEGIPTSRERYGWHELNIVILESVFSSDRVSTQYKEFAQKLGIKPDSFSSTAIRTLKEHIESLAASTSSFPYFPDNAIPESSPTSPVKMPANTMKWEFGTIEVEAPGRDSVTYAPSHISGTGVFTGIFNLEKTLEMLSAEGWDIFAVFPSFQSTKHDSIVTSTYRLFFKRQARSGS
jgi:hypothetical protein